MPTFGSLFAGIGGIDLGLERAGWTCRWQVEWDAYCQRVLAKHWPDVPRYGDITTVDWAGVERVDLLAGGFPCQPFSFAGQRKGRDDDRWLWPEFARAIRALRPRLVLVENVPGLLAGGGMGAVLGGLAELGYDAEWDSVPAAAVGAPHLRYRVWIVGHRQADAPRPDADLAGPYRTTFDIFRGTELRDEQVGEPGSVGGPMAHADSLDRFAEPNGSPPQRERQTPRWDDAAGRADPLGRPADASEGSLADPNGKGPQGRPVHPERPGERAAGAGGVGDPDSASADAYAAGRGPRGAASQPGWWSSEPDVGRVAHGVPARVDRLRALGNAVVPQVVQVIGERLIEAMYATSD